MDNNKVSISFHNIDHSDDLREFIKQKIKKVIQVHEKHITRVDFTVSMENPKESTNPEMFKSSLHIHGKMRKEFNFESQNGDPKKTVSEVVSKAVNSLKKAY